MPVIERTDGGICPVCAVSVDWAAAISCPRCDAPHHQDCWEYVGRSCAIFGCAPSSQAIVPADRQALATTDPLATTVEAWHRYYLAGWLSVGTGAIGLAVFLAFFSTALVAEEITLSWSGPPGLYVRIALTMLTRICVALGLLGMFAAGCCALVYIGVSFPMERHRRKLEERLGLPLNGARGRPSREMADRLDPPGSGRVLLRFLNIIRQILTILFIAAFAGAAGCLPSRAHTFTDSFHFLSLIINGCCLLLLSGARAAIRHRMVYLSTVQNRLAVGKKSSQPVVAP